MKFEKLENIITISKGKKPLLTDEPDSNSIRFLQIDDLRNDNNLKYTNEKNGVIATKDDILLAWDGANAGTVGYGKEGYIGSTIAVLRKKDPKKYSTVFIGKFLQSQFEYLRSNATGATIPHIDRRSLENLKIPILEIEDQIRIANILSKAEALITQRKESLRLLNELLKSTFLEMFGDPVRNEKGWGKKNIKSICERFSDGPFGSNLKTEHYSDSGVRVVRLNNIGVGEFLNDDHAYIPLSHHEALKKYSCFTGDVLIGTMGDPNLRACLLPKEIPVAINKADCILCRPKKNEALPIYICFLLNSIPFVQSVLRLVLGQTRGRISMGRLSTVDIPIPPLKLQTQFAHIVEKAEALKAHYQTSLQELENLYGSLSQRAFKGELSFREEKLAMAAEPVSEYSKKNVK